MNIPLDNKTLLRRFCYLGSFESVYEHRVGVVKIPIVFPRINEVIKGVTASDLVNIIREVLHDNSLLRRHEALFSYAAYFSSDAPEREKLIARRGIISILETDLDLFMFCRYHRELRQYHKKKGLSHAILKAVKEWYMNKGQDVVYEMCLERRGAYEISHKQLMKLCHISDKEFGNKIFTLYKNKESAEVEANGQNGETVESDTLEENMRKKLKLSEVESNEKENGEEESTSQKMNKESTEEISDVVPDTNHETEEPKNDTPLAMTIKAHFAKQNMVTPNDRANQTKSKPKEEVPLNLMSALQELRKTKNKALAIKIIRKYKLAFKQIPPYFYRHANVMEEVIASMSHMDVLTYWYLFGRYNVLCKSHVWSKIKGKFNDIEALRKANVHPVVYLIVMDKVGLTGDTTQLSFKKRRMYQTAHLRTLYERSFTLNKPLGMRMHITLNLAKFYKEKQPRNLNQTTYLEAVVALAFGYYKREEYVDVYYYLDKSNALAKVPWTRDMNYSSALAVCESLLVDYKSQRLIAPILNGLNSLRVYDVFLTILPSSGPGNPDQSTDFASKFIAKYRDLKNPRVKYIIVDLLKFRRSLHFPRKSNQSILEICGLDEKTSVLIDNFIKERFA